MYKQLAILVLFLSLILQCSLPFGSSAEANQGKDVTDKMKLLGNPFTKAVYARNVWDMQVFKGSIYLGHGNSSNYGPAQNAGPIDIIRYSPESNTFIKDFTVDEEQIDIFRIIKGKLFIPGHDPRDSWEFGNFYMLDEQWKKVRTIPEAVHTYDMTIYNGKLFAATGSNGFGEVVSSGDEGKTWSPVKTTGRSYFTSGRRAYSLFEFKGKLYSSGSLVNADNFADNNLLCVNKNVVSVIRISGTKLFPDLGKPIILKLVRPTVVKNSLLFIAGKAANDHQYESLALYVTNNLITSKKASFPESSALPYDILVRGSTVYVLASLKIETGNYKNIVYRSNDLRTWIEVFHFQSDTFSRSFEELNGDFYFGLGCDTNEMPESTGNILKIIKTDYN